MTRPTDQETRSDLPLDPDTAIAVIGMAGRFPGARDVREFWEILRAGAEGIRRFSDEELLSAGVAPEQLLDPHYVKANGVLDRIATEDNRS